VSFRCSASISFAHTFVLSLFISWIWPSKLLILCQYCISLSSTCIFRSKIDLFAIVCNGFGSARCVVVVSFFFFRFFLVVMANPHCRYRCSFFRNAFRLLYFWYRRLYQCRQCRRHRFSFRSDSSHRSGIHSLCRPSYSFCDISS